MAHMWHFFRAGGFDQVCLDNGDDLLALQELDQKLWAVLSCPTVGLEFDERTLELIDTDHDGRIRPPEILAAVQWTVSLLKDAGSLARRESSLELSHINDTTPEGRQLLATARQILKSMGKAEAASISTADTAESAKVFADMKFNGDGIIPIESADSDELKILVAEVIDIMGPDLDRSGKPGVSQHKLDAFIGELTAYSDWLQRAEDEQTSIMPYGSDTVSMALTLQTVIFKIDDYFTRCRLAAFDGRAAESLNMDVSDYAVLASQQLSEFSHETERFPLSRIDAGKALPLVEGINPSWIERIVQFEAVVVQPVIGKRDAITYDEWKRIKAEFAAHMAWSSSKAGSLAEKLGRLRVREILAGNACSSLAALIAADKELEHEADALNSLDRLVRYHRYLHKLLNNFVSLRDFYTHHEKSIFQVGTLYIDGRTCELCLRVEHVAKHAVIATMSRTFLIYCDCVRKASNEKMTIVAAITAGESDNLLVGRNGLFYDEKGRDWDATIVHIIDNPISIRQAALSPYKRAARMISEQIQKVAAAKEKTVTEQTSKGIEGASLHLEKGKTPSTPFDVGKFAGIFAAIGLAVGAIGTAVASLLGGFLGLAWWKMPLAVFGLLLIVSGPSMIIAWFKLRGRTLAPMLDANGWAVNTKAQITLLFGSVLTSTAQLPEGTERSLQDPFSDKAFPWKRVLAMLVSGALLILLAWYYLYK